MTKERPILFNSQMVCAILAGTKTQTRRPSTSDKLRELPAPAEVGDVLWVRETWRTHERPEDMVDGIQFAADGAFVPINNTFAAAEAWVVAHDNNKHGGKWRPSIHMPKWAARIRLEVTDVSLERVQSITEEEARAEGIEKHNARDEFVRLWDRIYGPHSWTLDDYVWALTFRLR